MAAPMASPQEIVERDAAEALANDYWERIVMRALDVRQESPDSLSSSSSPLRSLPVKEFCETLMWLLKHRQTGEPGQGQSDLNADDDGDDDDVLHQWMLSVVLSDRGESEPDRPHVSKSLFLLFLLRFGPLEHCLEKVRDALDHGKIWFHGNQPRDPSERLLEENIKDGLFLVRYSSSPGHFTVDYIKNGKMYHFNSIRNNFAGPGVVVNIKLDSDKMKEFRYSSLSSFIVKNKHLYTEPCLNQRSHFYWAKLAIPPRGSIISVASRQREDQQRAAEKTQAPAATAGAAQLDRATAEAVKAAVSERVKLAFESDNRTELQLRDMGIGPELPSQLAVLTYLRVVDLSGNAIKRVSGLNLSALHELEALSLSDNELAQLPGSLFASLPSLRRFECSDNLLTQLPAELFGSVTLNYLDFSNNRLEDLPVKVSRLEQLQFLDLSGNELKVLPDTIGLLKQLEELNLRDNALIRLPASVSQLCSLNILNLENNKLTDIEACLLSLLDSNPYLEVLAEGNPLKNPLAIQQWKEKKARRQQQSLRMATNRISVDIFALLKMHSKARNSAESPSPRMRERKCSIGTNPFAVKHKSLWEASPEAYWVEVGQGERPALESLRLQEHVNLTDYCRFFYHQAVHANIIGLDKVLGPVCISIQKEATSSDDGLVEGDTMSTRAAKSPRRQGKSLSYRVLVRTRQGDRRLMIPAGLIRVRRREHYARSEDLLAGLRQLTKPMFSATKLRVIRDPASHPKFAELEEKLITNSYKFGVIYALDGQDETAMYNNAQASPAFEAFMGLLGDRVRMKDWPKYTGGLSTRSETLHSYYTTHEGVEIMFHVSTELPLQTRTDELGQQWERKRFLGNDIVMVVFYEGQKAIDPATFLSNFNHAFALVQPQLIDGEVRYRLDMCYKRGVAESIPHLPLDPVFEHSNYFRDFLITKLINAERCALSAPQFRRAQERVREELFAELLEQFPKQKQKRESRKDITPASYYVDPQMAQMLLKMAKGEK